MPPKPTNWGMIAKMTIGGAICCIGGPALVMWVSPTEEELFKKYNPELQKRSLENRPQKQQEFDEFVMKLREYSKSDKPIWAVAAEDEKRMKKAKIAEQAKLAEEKKARKEEIRKAGMKSVPGESS